MLADHSRPRKSVGIIANFAVRPSHSNPLSALMSRTASSTIASPTAAMRSDTGAPGELILSLRGRLDAHTVGALWNEALALLARDRPQTLEVDAADVQYCDGAGIGLLLELRRRQQERSAAFRLQGLRAEFGELLALFDAAELSEPAGEEAATGHLAEEVGRATIDLWKELRAMVEFVGELAEDLLNLIRHPRQLRWRDVLRVAELAGVNALPIVGLIGFLMGLIMAFESAIPMRQFGAEIFVADLVGLSMFRELGPLMTAVVLAGRSGSAFAAELGTMKVNEEIDALTTMGLEPVRFMVLPRVVAAVAVTPLLTVFSTLAGLLGGALVMRSLGYPFIAYLHEMMGMVGYTDILAGLVKAFAFGILVAGIGCLRGLQTRTGASAVGQSTTRAVVSGIVLIALADGVFSIVYYYLDL